MVRHEVNTDGGPVFPRRFLVARRVPTGSHTGLVGKLGVSACLVDELTVLVQHLQIEARLTILVVSGRILKDNRIFHNQDTLIDRIYQNIIGDGLRLTSPVPVTESNRREGSIGYRLQETIRTRIVLRRIDMQRMAALDSIGSEVHYADIRIGRGGSLRIRVHTIGTDHIRAIEVHIVDTVVLRAIDEDIRRVHISGTHLSVNGVAISGPYADVITTLQYPLKGIGVHITTRRRRRISLRTVHNTAHTTYPLQFTDLAVLDIKLIGCAFALPRNDQRRVLAMGVNHHIGRLLDLSGVDLEIINRDRREA